MAKTKTTTSIDDHAHRWRIGEPEGPESTGTCSVCGAKQTFKNWLATGDFITNEERRQSAA